VIAPSAETAVLRSDEGFRANVASRNVFDRDCRNIRASPATTLKEFAAYARQNKDKLSYASAGVGTVTHLAGESFKQLVDAPKITHIPYRGAGPGLIDLIAGVVPMMTPSVTSQVLGFHARARF
jgi:tripartite-type tricarboxylate transporter receptor subunit TctC